jgi:hypothetical protein
MNGKYFWLFLGMAGFLLLSACYWREPKAPQRTFDIRDLLLGQGILPSAWQATLPFDPGGEDLCSTGCTAIQYSATDDSGQEVLSTHVVYRYPSAGIAQRTFDHVLLVSEQSKAPVEAWTYQSPIAESTFFGCYPIAGGIRQSCLWAGRYEEFIVTFHTQLNVVGMSLDDLEQVARAIDAIMAEHLDKPLPTDPPES